uniref:Interleukin 6 receptor n=1 Tax=Leptobrachium leishanense TaxID=445787 RepID=A0A8C5QCW7_9ANUR
MLRVLVHRTHQFILLCAGLLSLAATEGFLCPKPVVSPDCLVVPMHSNVTLTCPGCSDTASWKRHSQTSSPMKKVPRLLRNVQYRHVDNYTCFRDKEAVCTVQLLVEEKLETPVFQCYLRYPTSFIICEWTPVEELPRHATITLIKAIIDRSQLSLDKVPCKYTQSTKKVKCRVKSEKNLKTTLFLSMCVMGNYDSKRSKMINSTVGNLVHPEPPANVTVSPVEGAARKLKVSWGIPKFWDSHYYGLHYEVQYSVETSLHTSNVTTTEPYYVIDDAVMGTKHVVMVRAQEEFHYGSWSSWSLPAEGTPWGDNPRTRPTQDPGDYDVTFYSTSENFDSEEDEEAPENPPTSMVRQYTLLVVGVNLGLCSILLVGIMMRAQMVRRQLRIKGTKLWDLFFRFSDGTKQGAQTNDSLLMTPCVTPTTEKSSAPTEDNGR